MPRKARATKGILGVPKRAGRQVFVFGRYAETLPSDESDDPDFTASASKVNKKRNKKENISKKRKLEKKEKTAHSTKKTDVRSKAASSSDVSRGWTELIPTELLLIIFQHAMKQIIGSSIPFLCRMARVCRRWREVASEPRLWRTVNLSTLGLKITTSPTILQTLAPLRLRYATDLVLDGWSKLTDKGIEAVGRHCPELQCIGLSQCESLTSRAISSLADKCHHLTSINIESTKINISGLQHIVEVLGSQLESLSLENCTHMAGERILPLIQKNCPNLEFLDVSGTNIRTLHVEKLQAGCPKLRGLSLANLLLNSTPKTNVKAAKGFPDLRDLDLSCVHHVLILRNDELLHRILWASKNLRTLTIRGPNLITAQGFRNLPDSPLEHLTYNNAAFAKVAAIVEKWHNTLESLDISSNRGVDDECMELLRNFEMPKLSDLDLNNTNITSDGVRSALNGCPNLKFLQLHSCRGLPRGVRSRYGELGIRNLPWRLAEEEQESD